VLVQDTGVLDKVRAVKAIVMEPRAADKENFDDVMRQFYDIIKNCSANGVIVFSVSGIIFIVYCSKMFAILRVSRRVLLSISKLKTKNHKKFFERN